WPRPPAGRFPCFTLGAALAAALLGNSVLPGQTIDPAKAYVLPTFQVDAQQDKGYRAQNSVSATRIATPIADLPFSISAFTQQFIEDTGATDLYDIVRYSAGLTSGAKEFNAGADSFTIRGFQQSPERNGFSEGAGGNVYVDTVNIERVEVVKGPAALLYGQVSPGGTVNYITKTPQEKPFAVLGYGFGSDSYSRETLDTNIPLIPGTLLFRFNGAYENGFQYENITNRARTTVLSPSLTWEITKKITLKLNYQSFFRFENPAAVYPPNMDVATPASIVTSLKGPAYGPSPSAALTSATGVDTALGYKDAADVGFAGPYPGLPTNFDYDNTSDWRKTKLQTFDAELDVILGDHWVARADFTYNRNNVAFNQTGIGDVFLAPPGSLIYTPGASGTVGTWSVNPVWNALSAAAKTASELAFAQQILADPAAALQAQQSNTGANVANPAIIPRRPRLQEVYGHVQSVQAEFAGKYDLSWVHFQPLFGAYYDASWSYNIIHLNTGSATSPYYQTWDVNPASPTFYLNQSPTPIQPGQYTSLNPDTLAYASNEAAYAVFNASFLHERLYAVAGLRYNQSQSISTNFLGTTPAAIYGQGFKAHYTTPQLGLGYKVTPDSMIYASYSTSYTFSGGFLTQPQLVNGVETAVITGQQKPVTSEGEEIGYKTDFLNGRLSSTLALYRIVQSNGVQAINTIFPSGTIATSVQGAAVRSQGVEYEVTWSPLDNLQVFGSFAEDDVRNVSEPVGDAIYLGAHPAFTSKTLYNLWSRYTFVQTALKHLWIGAGLNYVGPANGNTVNPYLLYPGYTLYNSAAGYDWKWGKNNFSAVVNWNNMTNKFYQPADQEVGLPRRVTVTLTAHF
ncbi:MAG: TonB-dependent siderophore receptor, partial [Opitutales bacterium]